METIQDLMQECHKRNNMFFHISNLRLHGTGFESGLIKTNKGIFFITSEKKWPENVGDTYYQSEFRERVFNVRQFCPDRHDWEIIQSIAIGLNSLEDALKVIEEAIQHDI